MIVPAGILIARRIEQRPKSKKQRRLSALVMPLAASAFVSLAVSWADCKFANTARLGATKICEQYSNRKRTVWFQGHWGYQYYMEQLGAKAIDAKQSKITEGDIIAVPTTNTNIFPMPAEWIRFREAIDIPLAGWLATMNLYTGAGFYAACFWAPSICTRRC